MIKSIKIAAMVVASAVLAGASIADVVAGWDFSQYSAPGTLNTGSGFVKTLSANYTPGGGSGTMYLDGSNGSTNVGANEATAYAVVSREARYASNMDANEDFQGFDNAIIQIANSDRLGSSDELYLAYSPKDCALSAKPGLCIHMASGPLTPPLGPDVMSS